MKYLKLFEELYHPVEFDVKYYWRRTINNLKDYFFNCGIQINSEDKCITVILSKNKKSCEIKFDGVNCLLNGEKVNPHDGFFKRIRSELGL